LRPCTYHRRPSLSSSTTTTDADADDEDADADAANFCTHSDDVDDAARPLCSYRHPTAAYSSLLIMTTPAAVTNDDNGHINNSNPNDNKYPATPLPPPAYHPSLHPSPATTNTDDADADSAVVSTYNNNNNAAANALPLLPSLPSPTTCPPASTDHPMHCRLTAIDDALATPPHRQQHRYR
jgi:hypothetical protein